MVFYCKLSIYKVFIEMFFTVAIVILLPFRSHFKSKMFVSNILVFFFLFSQFLDLLSLKKQTFFFFIDSQMLLVKWTETSKESVLLISFSLALKLIAIFGWLLPTICFGVTSHCGHKGLKLAWKCTPLIGTLFKYKRN